MVSDPRLKEMTKVRWLWEAWQLKIEEEATVKKVNRIGEQAFAAFKETLCSVIGTNLEPIPQEDGKGNVTYRWPNPGEYTPLIFAIARPDYLKSAFEKIEKIPPLVPQEETPKEDEYTEEDLEFFDELPINERKAFWHSTEMQQQVKQYVIQMDPKDVDPSDPQQPKPTGLTEEERQEFIREKNAFGKPQGKPKFEMDDDVDIEDIK